jgi:amino-acid N-acetyltransferase
VLRKCPTCQDSETRRQSSLRNLPVPHSWTIRRRPLYSSVVALLEAEGLPASDLTDAHLEHFFFAGSEGSMSALMGLQMYGRDALLRSLVVSKAERGQGLGSILVRHAETYAASRHVCAIYLLTSTAEPLFSRLGYRHAERESAPVTIRSTREFADLCPASSAFMVKHIRFDR